MNSPLTPGSSASGAASIIGFMPTELFTSRSRTWGVSGSRSGQSRKYSMGAWTMSRFEKWVGLSTLVGGGWGQQTTSGNTTVVATHRPPSGSGH